MVSSENKIVVNYCQAINDGNAVKPFGQTKRKSKQSGPKSEESDRVKIWAVWLSENHWTSKNLIIGQVKIRTVWPSEKKQIHRYRSKKHKASPHLTWQPAVLINLDCALDKMSLRTRTMTRARLMTMTRTRINGGGWLEGLFLEVWDRSRRSNLIEIWGEKFEKKRRTRPPPRHCTTRTRSESFCFETNRK